ncbi:MAG: hypothetical protein K0R90_238 [Oscillospiraceae bacterium]|jgi:hypothetical protein|nr:hypothetical protein [Oscillospiraceae bacterium]
MGFVLWGGIGDNMFSIVSLIVIIGFVFVFGIIIIFLIQGAKQWKRNNKSPILTVDATMATKRTEVNHYYHKAGNYMSSTTYYATFEVSSGDRLEFKIPDVEYGMLVENDIGKLTFQGTRYWGFEHNHD